MTKVNLVINMLAPIAFGILFFYSVKSESNLSTTSSPEALNRIDELCKIIKTTDQAIYLALETTHEPSRNKEILKRNLNDYNEALTSLVKISVDHRDDVLRMAKEIFDEGLPKYFRVEFAEFKLQDELDMNSDEIENIYVYRGRAMEIWSDLHVRLGIPWFVVVHLFTLCLLVIGQQTEAPVEYEYEIPEIVQMLIKADNELVGKLQNRVKGEGESVMKIVCEFNDNLTSITERHKEMFKRGQNDTILEATPLIDHGSPEFINFYSDRHKLEQDFGINNISSRIMECQRQNTIDIWEDFVWFYNKAVTAKKDNEFSDEDSI